MNMLAESAQWLGEQLQEHAGRAVLYRQGGETIEIVASPAMQQYTIVGRDGVHTQVVAYEWLIPVTSLPFKPREGDRIDETISGELQAYDVAPVANKPAVEFADANHVLYLVRSNKLKARQV